MMADDLTPIIRVVRKFDGAVFPMQSAHEVAVFLWGRDIQFYDVFVRGTRVPLLSADITDIEATVEAAFIADNR